jgi:hypothetical protein
MLGTIIVVVGILVAAVGIIPSHFVLPGNHGLGGLGGQHHLTADALAALGVVIVIVGVVGMMRSRPA